MSLFDWRRWLNHFFHSKQKPYRKRPKRRLLLEVLEDRLAPATFIWSGAGVDANWSTPANWSGGVAPSGSVASLDDLVFPNTSAPRNTVNDLNDATFNSISFSGQGYSLSGSPLTLGDPSVVGSGRIIVNAGAAGQTVSFDIQLGGAAGSNQFFTVQNGGSLTIDGELSGSTGAELTKNGLGTLTLAGDNSGFTGAISLENNGGIVRITHANALGDTSSGTTIGSGAQIQVSSVADDIPESLIVNGFGIANDGALLNVTGNNNWTGDVNMDSDSAFGALGGTTLTIVGEIGDLGAGHNLFKDGPGTIAFLSANSYRGLTTINDGTLRIEDSLALGAAGTPQSGTLVNDFINTTATLQVGGAFNSSFEVRDEWLTLNGPGVSGQGALNNFVGDNIWAGNVILGSPPPNGSSVRIGAATNTNLTIGGVISNPNGGFSLRKVGTGKLILNNANTYTSSTTVAQGILSVRDSQALGPSGSGAGTSVFSGAALELEVDSGTVHDPNNLAAPRLRELSIDSIEGTDGNGPQLGLTFDEGLTIRGNGFGNTGALRSVSGINQWVAQISLSGTAGIGVEADPNASNTNEYFTNDYSLTAFNVRGGNLRKVGAGHLIFPTANGYGSTTVEVGWLTIQNNQSLGSTTRVLDGGAVHLKPLTPGDDFTLVKNFVLEGTGITHPFALISGKGALQSLGGDNIIGGPPSFSTTDIRLSGVAGIGVELLAPHPTSSLTVTGSISDFNNIPGGGIAKLGSRRLTLLGEGTYSGDVSIDEGVMLIQHDAALGLASTGTSSLNSTIPGNQFYTTTTTSVGNGISELQSLTISGAPDTYVLRFSGHTNNPLPTPVDTNPLPFNATPLMMEQELNQLFSDNNISGTVAVNQAGNTYTILFGGAFVGKDILPLQAINTGSANVQINTLMDGDGTALELESGLDNYFGGVSTGLQIWNERLVLGGVGNTLFNLEPLSVRSNDNLWRGPVTLRSDSVIHVPPSARLTLLGDIDDAANPSPSGSSLTLVGGGEFGLAGDSAFRGTTFVNQGVLVLRSSQALGSAGVSEVQLVTLSGPTTGEFELEFDGETTTRLSAAATATEVESALEALGTIGRAGGTVSVSQNANVYTVTFGGNLFGFDQSELNAVGFNGTGAAASTLIDGAGGTVIDEGSSVELQGNLTIAGEPLIIHGEGAADTSFVPERWFPEGPAPINNGQNLGNHAVTGRVTGVVVAGNPDIIYITTAGGGAWRTENGGKTWAPLFDLRNGTNIPTEKQTITFSGPLSGDFFLTLNGETTGLLSAGSPTLITDIETALSALPSVALVGGRIVVSRSAEVLTVSFQGGLAGFDLPQMTAQPTGATNVSIGTLAHGYGIVLESQSVSLSGTPGTYDLTHNGETTNLLPSNATATQIEAELNALPSIGGVGGRVIVDRPPDYVVEFGGAQAGFDLPPITGTGTMGVTVDVSTTRDGSITSEVQEIIVAGTMGDFNLDFRGAVTPMPLPFDATALDIEMALNNLPTIGGVGGTVTVTTLGGTFSVAFGGSLAGTDVPDIIATIVTAGPTVMVTEATKGGTINALEQQEISVSGMGGTFTLEFNGQSTPALPVGAPASQVQNALNNLSTIGGAGGNVTVTTPASANVITISFDGSLRGLDLPLMTASSPDGALASVNPVQPVSEGYGITAGLQEITVLGSTGSFTLTFDGATTNPIPLNASALEVEQELNRLPTIGGRDGSVKVSQTGNTYTVEFFGDIDVDISTLISAVGSGGATVTVNEISQGILLDDPGYVGTITRAGNTLYIGTGEANNSDDSFYGTGIYRSTDQGNTWSLVTDSDGANPFWGKVISDIVIDGPRLYTAVSDLGYEVQRIRVTGAPPPNSFGFSLNFGGDRTGSITWNINNITNHFEVEQGIEEELNALPSIRDVGGRVTVDALDDFNYTVVFHGTLANVDLPQLSGGPRLSFSTIKNGRLGNPRNGQPTTAGIWRLSNGEWLNMTAVTSAARATTTSQQGAAPAPNPPSNPGPDDDFHAEFPQGGVVWSDIQLIYTDIIDPPGNGPQVPVLYAAMGHPYLNSNNGVYRTENPESDAPIWFVGDPGPQQDEIQRITIDSPGLVGTVQFFFNGAQTPPNATDPSFVTVDSLTASVLEGLLRNLPTIGSPNVNVTMVSSNLNQVVFDVTFVGARGGFNQPLITALFAGGVTNVTITEQRPGGGPDARVAGRFPMGAVSGANRGNVKLAVIRGVDMIVTTVYAAVVDANNQAALLKSTNGGRTWGSQGVPDYLAGRGDYASAIVAANANNVFVGGFENSSTTHAQQLLQTTNGGTSWTDISVGTSNTGPQTAVHALTRDSRGRLLAATDGGLWRRESNGVWTDLNGNLAISQINGVASHPTDPTISYAGTQSNGTQVFSNNLAWTMIDDHAGRSSISGGGQIRVDPNNPNNIYHVEIRDPSDRALIRRSTDGGATWTTIRQSSPSNRTVPLVLDPQNSLRLLTAGSSNLEESTNGGNSWNSLRAPTRPTEIAIATFQGPFVADPSFSLVLDKNADTYDPDTIYITDGFRVFLTKNRGQSWQNRTSNLPTQNTPTRSIVDLHVDPTNRDTVYAVRNVFENPNVTGDEGRVFVSTDAGQSWTDITHDLPNMPVWKIVLDPRTGNRYVGTDLGVWVLEAGATNWRRIGSGMPNVQVKDLELNQTTNTLLAGTYGRSVFRLFLDDGAADSGALRAVSGSSVWAGPIQLIGDSATNTVAIGAFGTNVLQNGIATAQLNIVGSISDHTPGDNPRLVKMGEGDVVLSGSNTYGGVTEIKEGALVVNNPQALGSPSSETVIDNVRNPRTALHLQSDLDLEPITLKGDGITFNDHNTGGIRSVSNDNTFTGVINLLSNSTIGVDSGSSLTIREHLVVPNTGVIQGSFGFTKELTGRLTLANANTYTGTTLVNQGELQIQHARALGTTTNGTDVLDGAQLEIQTPSIGPNAGQPVVAVGETLTLSGTGISNTGAVQNTGGNNTWQGPVVLNSNPVLLVPSGLPATTPPNQVAFGSATSGDVLTIDGVISESGGVFGFHKRGPGIVALAQDNTYSGVTTVFDGALRVQDGGALGTTAANTIVIAGAVLELDGDPGGNNSFVTVPEPLVLNGFGQGGAGALRNISGDNAYQGTITLQTNTSFGAELKTQMTVIGAVQDPNNPVPVPAASLAKVGVGKVVFPNANPYSGKTFVNSGILNIQNALSLGNSGPERQTIEVRGASGTFTLTFDNGVTAPERTISLDIRSSTLRADIEAALTALPSINPGDVTVTQGAPPNSNVYTVTFGGQFALDNQRQLTAQPTPGVTVIISTIQDGPEDTIVNASATLQLEDIANPVVTEKLTINGMGFNNIGALHNLSGNNTWQNSITLGSNSLIGVADSNDTFTINRSIVDNGGGFDLTKVGPGTLNSTGDAGTDNNYGGLTQVNGGTLLLNKTNAVTVPGNLTIGDGQPGDATVKWMSDDRIQDDAAVIVNSDGVLDLMGQSDDIGPLTINDGQVLVTTGSLTPSSVDMNGGTVTITSGSVSTGNMDMLDGTVTINSGFLSTANLIMTGSTVTIDSGLLAASTDLTMIGGSITSNTGVMPIGSLNIDGGVIDLTSAASSLVLAGNVVGGLNNTDPARITGAGTLDLNGDTRTFTVNTGETMSIDVPISSNPNEDLIKAGGGLLRLNASASFAGLSTINAGTLQVDGVGGNVVIDGGTLAGSGTVGDVTTTGNGAGISPGPVSAVLTTGDVTLNSANSLFLDLNTTTPGSGHDQLLVNGSISLNGANLQLNPGPSVTVGDQFVIVSATGGLSGTFAQGDVIFVGTKKFSVTYTANTVVLEQVKSTTTTTLSSSSPISTYGRPLTITAIVTPEEGSTTFGVNDTVTFTIVDKATGGQVLATAVNVNAQGLATFDPQSLLPQVLDVGIYEISAHFNVSNDFLASDAAPIDQEITPASTQATLATIPATAIFGEPVTVEITINPFVPGGVLPNTGAPSGTITINHNGDPLNLPLSARTLDASGKVSFTFPTQTPFQLPVLSGGQNSFNVTYSGDANFKPSSSPNFLVDVEEADVTVIGSVSSPASQFGDPVTFTADVSTQVLGTPTGTVAFINSLNGQETLLGTSTVDPNTGKATLTRPASFPLPVGNYNVIARYDPNNSDKNFVTKDSAPLAHQVNKRDVAVTITSNFSQATPPDRSTFGETVTFTAVVTAVGGDPNFLPPVSGTVVFRIDGGAPIGPFTFSAGDPPRLTVPNLQAGSHTITAEYSGDFFYKSAIQQPGVLNHTVERGATTISLSALPTSTSVGQSVQFQATVSAVSPVPGTPTGTVRFQVGTLAPIDVMLQGGAATTPPISNLPKGTHQVTATYLEDGDNINYQQSTVTLSPDFEVKGAPTSIEFLPLASHTIDFGDSVTFTVRVSSGIAGQTPTGSVVFQVGGQSFAPVTLDPTNGEASLTVNDLNAGAYVVTAQYSGDSLFDGGTATLVPDLTVNKLDTSLTVDPNPPAIDFGDSVQFEAALTGATGTFDGAVTFRVRNTNTQTVVKTENVTPNASGLAQTPVINDLKAGTYQIEVTYTGATNYNEILQPVLRSPNLEVRQASTTTTVTTNDPDIVFGEKPLTFTALVTSPVGIPPGTVTFEIGAGADLQTFPNVTLVNGKAELMVNELDSGSHPVKVTYNDPMGNFSQSTGSLTQDQVVRQASTTTMLASNNLNAEFGEAIITATVTPVSPSVATPMGKVTFTVDDGINPSVDIKEDVINGVATLRDQPVGTYTITAAYDGNENFNASAAPSAITQTITQIATTTSVSALPSGGSTFSQQVNVTVLVTGGTAPPAGKVTIEIEDKSSGATVRTFSDQVLNNGQAIVSVSDLDIGAYQISANYTSDTMNFGGSSGTLDDYVVSAANTQTTLASSSPMSFVGQPVTFTAMISAISPATAIPAGMVEFRDNGQLLASKNLNNGQATLPDVDLSEGTHTITASYKPASSNFASSSTTLNQVVKQVSLVFTATPASVISGDTFEVTVQFEESAGVAFTGINGPVTLAIANGPAGGALGGTVTQNAVNGVVTFSNLTLNRAGTYTLRADFQGQLSADSSPITSTANRLLPSFLTTVTPNQDFTFTVAALDAANQVDRNFNGPVSVSKVTGPGVLSGTLNKTLINGNASFTLRVSASGTYDLRLLSGNLVTLIRFETVSVGRVLNPGDTGVGVPTFTFPNLDPQLAAQLSTLRRDHGFHFSNSFFFNFKGLQEKWFRDRNTDWHYITPSGQIFRWNPPDNDSIPDQPIADTDPIVYDNVTALLFEAPVSLTQSELDQLGDVRQTYGFFGTGNNFLNFLNMNEKWFKDRNDRWYFITPDGQINRWLGGSNFTTFDVQNQPLPQLPGIVYDDPNLLFNAAVTLTPSEQAAVNQARRNYGFFTTGNDFFNFLQLDLREKWFKDRDGRWYFLTPDGQISRWLGGQNFSQRDVQGQQLPRLSPSVYDDPSLLFNAPVTPTAAEQTVLDQVKQDHGFRFDRSFFFNFSGLNEKWFKDRNGVWHIIESNGRIRRWAGGTTFVDIGAGSTPLFVTVLAYDDPTLLF